jgi:hypothetical protein
MPERRFQDIWKEQCEAARGLAQRHGVVPALDYLIGEKLMDYAEMAVTRPEFARELPSFVAEIRSIFSADEIQAYLEHLDRMRSRDDETLSAESPRDDLSIETPEERTAATERFRQLKELLPSTVLGTA